MFLLRTILLIYHSFLFAAINADGAKTTFTLVFDRNYVEATLAYFTGLRKTSLIVDREWLENFRFIGRCRHYNGFDIDEKYTI
jgi:hypothetical protein